MSAADQATESRLSSIKTEILVAEIFAILVVIGWAFGFAFYFIFVAVIAGLTNTCSYLYCGTNTFLGVGLIFGIFFLILMVPSVIVLFRINKMRKAANHHELLALKRLNSIGWAIVGLLFAGVIPGIMLIVAHGPIDEIDTQGAGGAGQTIVRSTSMTGPPPSAGTAGTTDRLIKLKALLDAGVITNEDFEEQKRMMLAGGKSIAPPAQAAAQPAPTAQPVWQPAPTVMEERGSYCGRCGWKATPSDMFCGKCGNKL